MGDRDWGVVVVPLGGFWIGGWVVGAGCGFGGWFRVVGMRCVDLGETFWGGCCGVFSEDVDGVVRICDIGPGALESRFCGRCDGAGILWSVLKEIMAAVGTVYI